LSGIFLVVIGYFWLKERDWGFGLIFLGGMLNWTERLVNGFVVDYWQIPLTNIYNNINDYLIFIGSVWLIIKKWKKTK